MENLFEGVEMEHIKDDGLSMHDLAGSCKECITKHGAEFQAIFGVRLTLFMSGIHLIIGFDIVAFDKQVILSGDKCMADTIKEKYGDRAAELIVSILQYPKI